MKRIAQFFKVSECIFGAENYKNVKLPLRATKGAAGYDFFSPEEITLNSGESLVVKTGIRVKIEEGWVLNIYPKSGLGFKYRLQLDNTVGIIDSDYFYSDNEGHILIKITNDSKENKRVVIPIGKGFAQGVFTEYGITLDDDAACIRNGGFGSTDFSLEYKTKHQ